ncbi:MAG TPA: triose-phosphate isomerase [Rhabdochlamydiaceae bacterium]|nr:triose-phosphate isomerase [Rhabdochlamydiaceae bacterium]
MRKIPIIAGNWKMYKTIFEAKEFFASFLPQIKTSHSKIFIAPPFTALDTCAQLVKGSKVQIGAQNMSPFVEGAYTGEISGKMIKEAGGSFVILGHSERRGHFHETNAFIHQKLKAALLEKLIPILCIGETDKEREEGRSFEVILKQIDECLLGFSEEQLKDLIIAYEPIWAIGTGKTATPQLAEDMHHKIRQHIGKKWGIRLAEDLPILYGGSVKSENIASLLKEPDIDGALVGGASLDASSFAKIVSLGTKS